jgi:hypothetical protein
MKTWSKALPDGLRTGALAAAASLLVLGSFGRRDSGSAVAPLNAVSHMAWGPRALSRNRPDLRHTLTGTLLHVGSGLFWGVLFEKLLGRRGESSLTRAVGKAALASAAIATIDLKLVPERLTPGFQHRLSRTGLVFVFAAIGAALAAGTLTAARRDE